jgi:DNA-binding transcriptional MocR family regulator
VKRNSFRGDTAAGIAASIEDAVRAGTLAAGAPLPTIRHLAASLRVSPVTVAAAYRRLQARGLVVGEGRRGTRVRPTAPPPMPPADEPRVGEGVIDLATGNPDPLLLPPLEGALRAIEATPHLYGEPPALRPLAAFAAGELAADGVESATIAVASGGLDAIERLLREHLRPGDRVGVEDPTLPALLDLIGASGYVAEPFAVDADGPRPDAIGEVLARGVRALIVTPRAQNPTGAALSPSRAADLTRLLGRHRELLVIENDPAGPVAGVPFVTLSGSRDRWAIVRSTSKFLGPDLRVAIVAGDERTIARLQGRQALGVRWVSHLLQRLALSLWSDPSSGRRLARAADVYAHRRAALVEALASHGIRVTSRSGFNLWIPVREETSTVQALADRGWAVAAGERFRIRAGPGIRVTTAALPVEAAPRLAADLAEAVRPSAAASA